MRNVIGRLVPPLLRPACLMVALALLATVTEAQVAPRGQTRLRGIAHARGPSGDSSIALPPPANIPYNGGEVMPNSTTYAFWWGNAVDFPPDAQKGLDEFLEGLDGSAYLAIADQYMFGQKAHTHFGGNIYDPSPVPQAPIDPVTFNDVFGAEVCSVLSAKGTKPDPNGIYMVYTSNFPLDMTSLLGACAFHEPATCSDGTIIKLAYMPNNSISCGPSTIAPLFAADKWSEATRSMANVSAHEFMETITDPNIDAWVVPSTFTEIGDLCNFIFERGVPLDESRWKIQDIWSNQVGGCLQGAGREALVVGEISNSGATTAFNVPDAIYGTTSASINAKGQDAGQWVDAGNGIHGFVRDSLGNFAIIDVPAAGSGLFAGTVASSISSTGDVTGYYFDSGYLVHGFVRSRTGNFLSFDAPGASPQFLEGSWGTSINTNGDVAGGYYDLNLRQHGMVRYRNGSIVTFEAPRGENGTFARAINDGGTIAGDFVDSGYVSHGYVRDPRGNITTFDAPGSFFGTFAYGINAEGEVAGYYSDANGFSHAYVRDRAGNFHVTQIPWANFGTVAQSINDAGATAGSVTLPAPSH